MQKFFLLVFLGLFQFQILSIAQTAQVRDEFFWLSEINKASLILNHKNKIVNDDLTQKIHFALDQVINEGNKNSSMRPSLVIKYEPLLIRAGGPEVTFLHAGRSSQDMHATYRAAILKDDLLELARLLNLVIESLIFLSDSQIETIVPNYTNGVVAQPNRYSHYLLGYIDGFNRDFNRIQEAYFRTDRCPMGTSVLNGTSWPMDRKSMAEFLGFSAIVENAYDAAQISSSEEPIEAGTTLISLAIHISSLIEDITTQYAQSKPWILLAEGGKNTYVSSAMPQKRNPGLLNDTRSAASSVLTNSLGPVLKGHNIQTGMADPKNQKQNHMMLESAFLMLKNFNDLIHALKIDSTRALEEINSDWSTSEELADYLTLHNQIPFREAHHFVSNLVEYAKQHNIKPMEFPFDLATQIFNETLNHKIELTISSDEFYSALNPLTMVENRITDGGSQRKEVLRMLNQAKIKNVENKTWLISKKGQIDTSLFNLDKNYDELLKKQ